MGYTSKNIARITEPKILTLSALPNFVQFAKIPAAQSFLELNVKVLIVPTWRAHSYYTASGVRVNFNPTSEATKVWNTSRLIDVVEGQNFVYKGGAIPASFCVFFNASGGVVSTFQTSGGTYSGVVPAGAVSLGLTTNTDIDANPTLTINGVNVLAVKDETRTLLNITQADGTLHQFSGTTDEVKVGGNIFYIAADPSDTAENLRQALLADPWIKANYDVVIPFSWSGASPVNGSTLNIKAKLAGQDLKISVVAPNNNGAYSITWIEQNSINNDSISGEASTAEIELDVYTDPEVFLGEDDRPITTAKIGHYLTTLSKTYAGAPLWFELNALFAQYPSFNLPPVASGWFNTGTASVYRFIAKVRAVNSYSFYQSNALYVINGYGRVSDDINLEDYIYSGSRIKLLTNKPKTPYIKGQKEYLNFILRDDQRGLTSPSNYTLRVCYRAYSTAGDYLGTTYAHSLGRASFGIVNTCVLDIDGILTAYPTAGIVKVSLANGTVILSNDLEYTILPECLHTLQQFSFLNRLGGWDAFNFDAAELDEIKPESTTYNKTLTPNHKKGDSLETVYSTSLANPYTIEGAPVYDDVAEWLKELAAAKVILNNNGEYVILEDFELKRDPAKKNMQTLKVKYRLSENYTND